MVLNQAWSLSQWICKLRLRPKEAVVYLYSTENFVSSILINMKCLSHLKQGLLGFILVLLFGMEITALLALFPFFTGSQNNNLKSITRHLATRREDIK